METLSKKALELRGIDIINGKIKKKWLRNENSLLVINALYEMLASK